MSRGHLKNSSYWMVADDMAVSLSPSLSHTHTHSLTHTTLYNMRQCGGPTQGYHFPGGPGPWWASHPISNKWGHWKIWEMGVWDWLRTTTMMMMMEGEGERGLIGTHGLQSTRGHVRHADLAQWHTEGLIGFDCSVTDRLGQGRHCYSSWGFCKLQNFPPPHPKPSLFPPKSRLFIALTCVRGVALTPQKPLRKHHTCTNTRRQLLEGFCGAPHPVLFYDFLLIIIIIFLWGVGAQDKKWRCGG
jgi:hypothetical protein